MEKKSAECFIWHSHELDLVYYTFIKTRIKCSSFKEESSLSQKNVLINNIKAVPEVWLKESPILAEKLSICNAALLIWYYKEQRLHSEKVMKCCCKSWKIKKEILISLINRVHKNYITLKYLTDINDISVKHLHDV